MFRKAFQTTVLTTLIVSSFLFISATPASAHGIGGSEPTNSKTVITSIQPETKTFEVKSIKNGEEIELTRTGNRDIVVLGVDNEPYILINKYGTFINEKSATRIINESMNDTYTAEQEVREYKKTSADPSAKPMWIKRTTSQTYSWHDHRAHYMGSIPEGTNSLGSNEIPIMSGANKHIVALEFVTTQPANIWLFAIVAIALLVLILSAIVFTPISKILWSKIFLISSSATIVVLEIIHIVGYVKFSDTSIMESIFASLYGVVLVILALLLLAKLAYVDKNDSIEDTLNKRAPLLCVSGFVGLVAGALVEYEMFTHRFLSTTINPSIARTSVLIVGLLSLNLLVCGLKHIKGEADHYER